MIVLDVLAVRDVIKNVADVVDVLLHVALDVHLVPDVLDVADAHHHVPIYVKVHVVTVLVALATVIIIVPRDVPVHVNLSILQDV